MHENLVSATGLEHRNEVSPDLACSVKILASRPIELAP